MRNLLASASCLLLTALVVACASSPPPSPPPPSAPPPLQPPGAMHQLPPAPADANYSCQTDADCTIVEMGCCDHCNGGWVLSVAKGHEDAAKTEHHEASCVRRACTERGCDMPVPMCRDGVCARTEKRFDAATGQTKIQELPNTLR